jgi:hypothetical protein
VAGQRIESGEHHLTRGKVNENKGKNLLGGVWEKEIALTSNTSAKTLREQLAAGVNL